MGIIPINVNRLTLPSILTSIQELDFPHKLGICERVFGRRLSSQGQVWVDTGAGIPWKLDLANPTHRWIVYGKYEGSAFLNWAKRFLNPNAIVVDSGANIGQMVLYLAQWARQGKVLAFEPGRKQADWLEECLTFHTQLPVEVVRRGLGAAPATLFLKDSGHEHLHGSWSQVSDEDGEPIEIVRLADELAARSIDRVDLWKLDVEGFEVPALQGAELLLRERRVGALYVELAGSNGDKVRNYLAGTGYSCYLFDRRERLYEAVRLPQHTNGLFLPNY